MLTDTAFHLKLFGDEAIAHGVHVGAQWHAKHATPETPVYIYFLTLDAFGVISFIIGASKEVGKLFWGTGTV